LPGSMAVRTTRPWLIISAGSPRFPVTLRAGGFSAW